MRRKGIFGEELPATLLTVILLVLFIAASLSAYSQFFGRMGLVERERAASSVTEFIFYSGMSDTSKILAMFDGSEGLMVSITDMESDSVSSTGSVENASSASVSSSPLLIYDSTEGRYHLARVDVYAGD